LSPRTHDRQITPVDAESWETISKMPTGPYRTVVDGGIKTRWLADNATTPFKVQVQPIISRSIEAFSEQA